MGGLEQAGERWTSGGVRVAEVFRELIDEPWGRLEPLGLHPSVDIHETDDAFVIVADLPQVSPEDVAVMVSSRWVTLTGERREAAGALRGRPVVAERFVGRFCRRLELPEEVEQSQMMKHHEGGVLVLTLPKRAAVSQHGWNRGAGGGRHRR